MNRPQKRQIAYPYGASGSCTLVKRSPCCRSPAQASTTPVGNDTGMNCPMGRSRGGVCVPRAVLEAILEGRQVLKLGDAARLDILNRLAPEFAARRVRG